MNNRSANILIRGFSFFPPRPLLMMGVACGLLFLAACVPITVKPTNPGGSAVVEVPSDQQELVRNAQLMLQTKGFAPGPIDGIDGPLTKAALREFQDSRGLPPTGYVNQQAYHQLATDGDARTGSTAKTSASQQMRADSRFFNQSYLQACGLGLAFGGVLAMLTAGDSDDANKRMLIGAGVACAAAMGTNHWLQGQRERAIYKEEDLKQILTALEEENRKLTRLVNSSKDVVSEDRQRIAEIDAAYRNKQISLEQAKQEISEVDGNKAHLERTLVNLENRQKTWKELGSKLRGRQAGSKVSAIESEIATLERKIQVLKDDLSALERARRVSVIG